MIVVIIIFILYQLVYPISIQIHTFAPWYEVELETLFYNNQKSIIPKTDEELFHLKNIFIPANTAYIYTIQYTEISVLIYKQTAKAK